MKNQKAILIIIAIVGSIVGLFLYWSIVFDDELIFPNSYFLDNKDTPEGFELLDEDIPEGFEFDGEFIKINELEMLDSMYGGMDINTIKEAYTMVYVKTDGPDDELGIVVIKYKSKAALNLEVDKIQSGNGYEPIAPDDIRLKLIGAQPDTIYLYLDDVLVIVWADETKDMPYVEFIADIIKDRIIDFGGEEI
jgi:hypothetical protein